MKDIVVAIDFSKGSMHALEYAIEMANVTNANICMVWVDNMTGDEAEHVKVSKELHNEARSNFNEIELKYKDKMKGKLSFKLRKGKVYQELANYVKQNCCSLLVVGAHGTSGFEEFWIGTNAFRIVSSISCPVVTVKYSYDNKRSYRKILMPVYHTPQTLEKVAFTADLAAATGADINILAINSSGLRSMQRVLDSNVATVKKHLEEKGIKYIVDKVNTENIAADIINHARMVDTDLIAIMTDIQDQANSIMLGSFAQQLVNYSPVPVLTIHPKNHFTL